MRNNLRSFCPRLKFGSPQRLAVLYVVIAVAYILCFGAFYDVQRFINSMEVRRNFVRNYSSSPAKVPLEDDRRTKLKVKVEPKKILIWTPFWYRGSGAWKSVFTRYYFNQCRVNDCEFLFKHDRVKEADAVLFSLIDYNPKKVPAVRDPKQLYIAFTLESPGVVVQQNRLLNTANFFNLTMSYRRDSDIVVPYGRIVRRREPQKEQDYWSAKNSSKFIVWFVSDCSTQSKREHYVKELRK
ncbi:alpha-(1,3)-fucosyltransferase C-like [Oratosquilla oratoria]|uniref:alpha-(1,3)-fucosyltransferase C-like n=1 Tax=Oratosquilla oratoria TaxID=337810 RepID=UPI003F75C7C3